MPGKLLTAGHGAPDPAEYMQNTIYFDIDSGRYYEADGSGHLFASASTGQMSPMATFNSHRNRTDNPHVVTYDQVGAASTAQGAKADTALQSSDIASKVNTSDSRLSDARTPTAHASTHAGGSDPLTLSEAQITNLTADLAAKVPATRSLSTTAPLSGGGDLSVNRVLVLAKATGSVDGYLAAADFTTFNAKQGALSFGNLTGANGIGVTGGTGAVIGVGVALSLSSVPNSALTNSSVTVNGTANQVAVSTSSLALGGTLTISRPALVARSIQNVTINANPTTIQPAAEILLVTSNVANAVVVISETGAVTGSLITIVNVGSNAFIVQDQAAVSETSGNFTVGSNDSISFVYIGDRLVEICRSNN